MKENPMIDVFDVSSDFNPDMILSNVFLDPSLDFMTSIDDADIMAQDFLHFATASGSGRINNGSYTRVWKLQKIIIILCAQPMSTYFEHIRLN
ncbi:hypothetical protein pipiens_012744 [Culex pipiens pipiens]|uniref:Uncharacterized protein n=1 Tax=Culex pipiens pipiens TaxID=38569 RepID=A0ABD1D149_CULPP